MNIQNLIIHTVKEGSPLTFFLVFLGAGLLSLSSCTLVRVPVVLGYIGGVSSSKKASFFILSGFIGGLVIAYTFLGIILGLGIHFLYTSIRITTYFYFISGLLLVGIGLALLDFLPFFNFSQTRCRLRQKDFKKVNFFTALFFGIIFAFFEAPVCPCCGPVLLIIASLVFIRGNLFYALSIFLTYALGQSFPIFLIGLFGSILRFTLPHMETLETYIQAISGTLLFCLGVYLLWIV